MYEYSIKINYGLIRFDIRRGRDGMTKYLMNKLLSHYVSIQAWVLAI